MQGRISTLDALRGAAVLGILLANIWTFSSPQVGTLVASPILKGADGITESALLMMVYGKFRSLLAMIFGAGVSLQFLKRSKVTGAWPGGYVKRSGILSLIGLVHGFLIWFGDVLFAYGMTGTAASYLVSRPQTRRKFMIVAAIIVSIIAVGSIALESHPGGADSGFGWATPAGEIAAYSGSNWFAQLKFRAIEYGFMIAISPLLVLDFLLLFCVGMLVFESGVLTKPSENRALARNLLLIGFGGGVPLTAVGALFKVHTFVELGAAPFMSLGYLVGGAILVEKFSSKVVVQLLTQVGKTALSVYLLQSILCSIIFYGWGLGLYGRFTYTSVLVIVPVVWTLVILFAVQWQKHFTLGPTEWLLRSLTEGTRLPIRP